MKSSNMRTFLWFFAVGIVLGGVYLYTIHARGGQDTAQMNAALLSIGDTMLTIDIANTENSREQGLSGRESLEPDHAMLFVFPEDGQYAFWMKEMQFPIDIVWIDKSGTIIDVDNAVSPNTFPSTFSPSAPVRYVLEANANFVSDHGIKIGDTVTILPKN